MRFRSIITRIVVLHIIAVFITSVVMSLALSWLLNVATNTIHGSAMKEQAMTLTEHLSLGSGGVISLDIPSSLQGLYSQPYGRYAYAVIDSGGRVLFSSRSDALPIFPADPRSTDVEVLKTRNGNALISGASIRKELDGKSYWVQAGEDLANRDVLIDDIDAGFFRNVGWITVPILLALLAIDIVIFRRALRPLQQASQIAQSIGPTRTDVRLPLNDIPGEIRPLLIAVNQAFERLDNAFRVQREFTADAAHELRTPLSILRTRVDTLDDRGIAEILHQDIDSMGRLFGQLLDIAELDASRANLNEPTDLHEVCVEVVRFMAPLAVDRNKEIALLGAPGPVWIRGNAELLDRAVRNLVENAIKHTSEGTTVELVVEPDGMLKVSDRGPGIPRDERELIFQRFWRRDRSQPGSSGLGLSIVQRIVELHGATISVGDRPAGGAEFVVRFAACGARIHSHDRSLALQ